MKAARQGGRTGRRDSRELEAEKQKGSTGQREALPETAAEEKRALPAIGPVLQRVIH
jgi:hypothetical protein